MLLLIVAKEQPCISVIPSVSVQLATPEASSVGTQSPDTSLIGVFFKVFLSGMISQDPLEKHFGMLQQKCKSNENPTVMECIKSGETLRIVGSLWLNDKSGNYRRSRVRKIAETKELPLHKRQ